MMSAALLHGLNHPLRRQILRILNSDTTPRGASEMTKLVTFNLPSVAHHARCLSKQNIIRCVRKQRVKGGVVHFYASNVRGNDLVEKILSEMEAEDAYVRAGRQSQSRRNGRPASDRISFAARKRRPVAALTSL
jgi:DNA-binding transcriptional ArsR family regulator